MKKTKSFIFCLLSVLFSAYAQAQDVVISGKVIDESGLPIPGATILIKGTSNAAATDMDGNYQIKAASSGTLVFPNNRNSINKTSAILIKKRIERFLGFT